MRLQVNQTYNAAIKSRCRWNNTKIEIQKGDEYDFKGIGEWRDFMVKTDADGYSNLYMRLFDNVKRAKDYKWFSLIGSLDKKKNDFFLIGKSNKIVFEKSGELYCFANDVGSFYWNNSGHLTLQITRLK